ncbi:MAG: carboxypeptidase regulatory-like domain-containing protein, partial [bacterium]|nr:carboxypeptidase regulatory-like domain-containing protein [bacterium]
APPPPPSIAERLAALIAPLLPAFPTFPSIPTSPPSFITDLPTAIALALPAFTPPLPLPSRIGSIALPTSPPGALPSSIAFALPQFKEPSFPPPASLAPPRLEEIPVEAPPALAGIWEPLSAEPATAFLFAPLPREFTALTRSFPSLGESFTEAGIATFADVGKIATAELSLPGLTAAVGLPTVTIVPGRYTIPRGIPIAELPHVQRQAIPFNVVFLRGGGELVDLPIGITLTDEGKPKLQAAVVAGQTVQLVLHPQERVERVKGYVVYRKRRAPVTFQPIPFQSIAASLLFATPVFAHPQTEPVEVVEELVLMEFEYTDPDGDGVYTAEVSLPVVAGEYEIITIMDHEDPSLGSKEIRLTTVVDPEGYVFERIGGREARIAGVQVMIERWSDQRGIFEPWPAGIYRQENPQTTDGSGTYSFLVPAGQYRLFAVARGYRPYTSERFDVQVGSGIHRNIALTRIWWNIPTIDTKTVLLVVLVLLVLYNFYRDHRRERRQRTESPPAAS